MKRKTGKKRRTGLSDKKLEGIALGMQAEGKLSCVGLMRAAGVGQGRASAMVAKVRASAPVGFQSEKAAQRAEAIEIEPCAERRQDGFMEDMSRELAMETPGMPAVEAEEFDEVAEVYPNPLLVRLKKAGIARKAAGDWPVGLKVPTSAIKDEGGHKWIKGRPRTRSKW